MSSHLVTSIRCGSRALVQWTLVALAITVASVGALGYFTAMARGQQAPAHPVDTLTEAENVPSQAEQVPDKIQPLPPPEVDQSSAGPAQDIPSQPQSLAPPTRDEGTTAAAMTAPPTRIDFRRFGVKFDDGTQNQSKTARPQSAGLTIAKVRAPSAASELGLEAGDQIISVGRDQVATTTQIGQAIEKALATSSREDHLEVPLVVRRGDAEQTLTLTNAELTKAGYGPLLTEFGHYVPPQYVTGYRGALDDPGHPQNATGAYLGVELDSHYRHAAIVSRVRPGTPAAQAGLQEGDRIFALNNRPVDSPNELIYWVSQMQPGDTVEISFDRAHDVDVTLGKRAAHASEAPAAERDAPAPSP